MLPGPNTCYKLKVHRQRRPDRKGQFIQKFIGAVPEFKTSKKQIWSSPSAALPETKYVTSSSAAGQMTRPETKQSILLRLSTDTLTAISF
jgi:hypothetical protein